MVEIIRTSVLANANSLILLFVFCTLVGFFLQCHLSWNKEKKKKGFKKNRLFGKDGNRQRIIQGIPEYGA